MYPPVGKKGTEQNVDSFLECIIQSKKLGSLNTAPVLSRKLESMQTQIIEAFHEVSLKFDEEDYELLCKLILVACEVSTILAAIAVMNEIGWPT